MGDSRGVNLSRMLLIAERDGACLGEGDEGAKSKRARPKADTHKDRRSSTAARASKPEDGHTKLVQIKKETRGKSDT